MKDTHNSMIINIINDEMSALRSRELKYKKEPSAANIISSPKFSCSCEGDNHGHFSSPVSIVDIDAMCTPSFDDVNSRLRVCEWMYKIVDHYQLERETIHVGMSMYERYIVKFQCSDMHQCQLLALAALYIAVKIYEERKKDTLSFFCKLSAGRFSERDIETMEIKLLTGLDWLVNPPSPQAFIYLYIRFLATKLTEESRSFGVCTCIYDVANYISELCLLQTNVRDQSASTIASASFLLAVRGINEHWLANCRRRSEVIEEILALDISDESSVVDSVSKLIEANLSSSNDCLSLQEIYMRLDPNQAVYKERPGTNHKY